MARVLALVVALLGPHQCSGAAAADSVLHSLRGKHRRHHRHFRAQIPSDDEMESKEEAKEDTKTPVYDDFLHLMNDASSKALTEQRAIPAYDDFLHFMKSSTEKAHKEMGGSLSYDEFLNFMKDKTDEAYQQQIEAPSYDDFLSALKESSIQALKVRKPVPSYEEFLTTLKDAAEKARETRVHQAEHVNLVKEDHADRIVKAESGDQDTFQAMSDNADRIVKAENEIAEGGKWQSSNNPLDVFKPEGESEDDDEDSKLQEELRHLKAEEKKHKGNHAVKKPLMKRINVLRTQLCWKRPNLWQHEKCLRFLGLHCLQESTGEGICKAFTKKAQEKCKSSEDARLKDDYCALGEALGESYNTDEEEEIVDDEHAEVEDDEEGEDEDEDHDALDEELDEQLSKEDEEARSQKQAGINDKDGDGHPDDEDAFPDDPSEWKDTDKDGVGDNADHDLDGDGHNNDVDVFPNDPKEWKDTDGDGIGDNADDDRDNDGYANDKDKFPDDPSEWLDSDGDGVGDNKDAYPFNPNCYKHDEPCLDLKGAKKPKGKGFADPASLDMDALRPVPEQGYNEHMQGPPVNHRNYYTYTGDWQNEFPDMVESERNTMGKICEDHPENVWCQRFAHKGKSHFR